MPIHKIALDMNKTVTLNRPEVRVRVGDQETQTLEVTLYDNGLPYTPTGEVLIQIKKRNGGLVRSKPMEAQANVLTGTIPTPAYSDHGEALLAYLAEYDGETKVATSSEFKLTVLPGTTDAEDVATYDEQLNTFMQRIDHVEGDLEAAEALRVAAEQGRVQAEEKREQAEAKRQEDFETAQEERKTTFEQTQAANKQAFDDAQSQRATDFTAAQNQRQKDYEQNLSEWNQAEAQRQSDFDEAQTSREDAFDAAEAERQSTFETAEAKRQAGETDRIAAEEGRVEAENARVAAEAKRAEDFTASQQDHEDTFTASEQARQQTFEAAEAKREEGEAARKQAEEGRVTAETGRVEAEAKRKTDFDAAQTERTETFEASEAERQETFETAEAGRAEAETDRVAAEADRAKKEAERQTAETGRDTAETERVADDAEREKRQAANDTAQAKNNADQAANNQAAYNHQFITLQEGQFDPDTRKPTIEEPLSGPVYRVPKETPSETNKYDEWYWTLTTDGPGEWEAWTATQIAEAPAIPTDKVDRITGGEQVSGDEVMKTDTLSYYDTIKRTEREADLKAQATKDGGQDTAIAKAQQTADDAKQAAADAETNAASALSEAVKAQATKDGEQDKAIEAANTAISTAEAGIKKWVTDEAKAHAASSADVAAKLGTETVGSEKQPIYLKDGVPTPGGAEIDLVTKSAEGIVPKLPEDATEEKGYALGWADGKAIWVTVQTEARLPDPRPLKQSIATATSKKTAAKVAGSGDYDFGTQVTDQASVDALGKAITTAQAVVDGYGETVFTQGELDAAKATLDAAVKAFDATLKPLTADKSGLTAQESRYTTLKQGVSTSANGKDIAFGGKWVTSAEQSAADTALSTARSTVEAATKQSQINSAVSTLKSALDTYQAAIKTATKDAAALDAAISAANAAKADVQASDQEGADLPAGSKYVTTAQMKALTDAIAAATTAKTASTTQAQLDAATSTLTTATSTFEGQIKTNWQAPEDIADASWDDIARTSALAAADPQSYQKYLGQTKVIDMSGLGNGCTNVTAMIIGIGHDVDESGAKLGFTFQLRDGLPYQTFTMNSSATTSGGWRDSLMRSTNIKKVKEAMPADLKSRLKTMVKKTNITASGTSTVETQDDIALLSVREVFGSAETGQTWWASEGEQYEWYAAHNTASDRIIKRADGSAHSWWLRSVYSSTNFCRVDDDGNRNSGNADYERLPCACFSV